MISISGESLWKVLTPTAGGRILSFSLFINPARMKVEEVMINNGFPHIVLSRMYYHFSNVWPERWFMVASQATCLWRRALKACMDMSRVLAPTLAKRLGTENTVANGLISRMDKEGFLRSNNRGKRSDPALHSLLINTVECSLLLLPILWEKFILTGWGRL